MERVNKEKIIISLGGSLIVPDEIDVSFISEFRNLILEQSKNHKQFYIIVGGGRICRKYQKALTALGSSQHTDLDWMGIYITHLNAQFLKLVFKENADNDIIISERDVKESSSPIVLGGGWEPGSSTDLRAVQIASKVGSHTIINLTNVDYAYDSDPNSNPNARKLEDVTWKEYRSCIPEEWDPGLSTPFDPIASKEAEEHELNVIIMNGKNVENLRNYFEKGVFDGTLIHP